MVQVLLDARGRRGDDPISLVGILPAHAAPGAFFTATSMLGFMAGAGIVVRNSIILVDFTEMRIRLGMPLERAVVDAGAVRFRPMLLTALAVTVGSVVILFDPISGSGGYSGPCTPRPIRSTVARASSALS